MDWIYNVPIKFYEYNLIQLQRRLNNLKENNILFIGSKRIISNFNLDVKNFDVIHESITNPDINLVTEVLTNLNKPDLIVCMGGGSTIDLGKIISAFYEYKYENIIDLLNSKIYLKNKYFIPLIAVPTTAGTGSECTKWATLWDFDNLKKYSVDVNYLYPSESWLVPDLTKTMDYNMTLSTGLDALAHAMESYWSIHSNSYTRRLSCNSIRIIQKYLPLTLKNLNNIEYRQKMLMGSFFAGLAFSNTRTTACHSISYPLTMMFSIPHGFAVAFTLFEVLKRNWNYLVEKELFLDAWNVDDFNEIKIWFDNVTQGKLILSNFGIKKENIPNIVKFAITGGRMDNNPIIFDEEEIKDILNCVF